MTMINLGLSSADLALYQRSLYSPPGYDLKITVQILDLNHRYVADVSDLLMDGQVNRDFNEKVQYSGTAILRDPFNQVGFDTSNPSDNALYADRMIRIVHSVRSELLPRWVDCPLFCGPVTKVSRDDTLLNIEFQGKESLLLPPAMAWTSRPFKRGTRLTSVLRTVLGTLGGETRFDLPDSWTNALAADFSVLPEFHLWNFALQRVGSKTVRHLFYDARGYVRLRGTPTKPIFTFPEEALLSQPKLVYNQGDIRNTVVVRGATPPGKAQLRRTRTLPASHPSSSTALGRKVGSVTVPRSLVEIIEDTTLNTQAAVDEQADQAIDSVGLANVEFDFDSFVFPHLEPGDVTYLRTRDFGINLRLGRSSIPLKASSPQANGVIRKLAANRARIRQR